MPPRELRDAHDDIMKSVTGHENEPDDDNDDGGNELDLDNEDQLDAGDDTGDDDRSDQADNDDPDDADDNQRRQPRNRDDDDLDPDTRRRPTDAVADDPDLDFKYEQDRKGNILDRDGKVLFAAGRSRNAWSKLKKAYTTHKSNNIALVAHTQKIAAAGRELLSRYNKLKETANPGATKGLTEAENSEAVSFMALAKIDPKAAVRSILTKLHMSGVDLSELGVTGPVDAKEIAKHTVELQEAKRLARQNERQESHREAAKREAHDFLIANPGAVRYQGLIADAKQRFPHLSLDNIWSQLQDGARQAAQKQRRGNGQQQNSQQRPLREPPPRNGSRDRRSDGKLSMKAVDPTQSFKQIGADLLRDLQKLE